MLVLSSFGYDLPLLYWICQMSHQSALKSLNVNSYYYEDWSPKLLRQNQCKKCHKSDVDTKEHRIPESLCSFHSIKTFDFSTQYTTISHVLRKPRLKDIIHSWFLKNNTERRHKYLVVNRTKNIISSSKHKIKKYTEEDITKNFDSLIDNILKSVWWTNFPADDQHSKGINCYSLLADLFLAPLRQTFLKTCHRQKKGR